MRDGSIVIGAQSCSAGMPTTAGVVQPEYAGDDPALGHGGVYGGDCYLARLAGDGRLIAASYFGGSKQERNVYGMAMDRGGNLVIATATRSPDAAVTADCFQPRFGGGPSDFLVAKLSPDLQRIIWCTYIGGEGDDFPRGGIALDPDDNVVVVGTSTSADFPTTAGVVQPRRNGPRDSAIAKLKADGSGLVFSTLLGGSGDEMIRSLALGPRGEIDLVGSTSSEDFPATAGALQTRHAGKGDGFVVKLVPNG